MIGEADTQILKIGEQSINSNVGPDEKMCAAVVSKTLSTPFSLSHCLQRLLQVLRNSMSERIYRDPVHKISLRTNTDEGCRFRDRAHALGE